MGYVIHSSETAPAESKATMERFVKAWGFLPNLGAVIAESPAAIELLWAAYAALTSKGTLSPAEQQVVSIAVSRQNRCGYCVSAHSTLAAGSNVPANALEALRDGKRVGDPKMEALRAVATRLARNRGVLSQSEKAEFLGAGFAPGQLLEVVGWVAVKTLTNYVNHLAETPVDPQWQGQLWVPND